MTIEMTQEALDKVIADQVELSLGTAFKAEFAPIREAMKQALSPNAPEGNEDEGNESPKANIFEAFDLGDELVKAREEMRKQVLDEFEIARTQVRNESTLQIGKIRREAHYAEFAGKVCTGNDDMPYGIPVEETALKDWMLTLNDDQAEFAKTMLEGFWKSGRIEFTELGHSKDVEGTKELPEDILEQLRAGELTLEDLRSPILFPVIGELAQYDLAEFRKEG